MLAEPEVAPFCAVGLGDFWAPAQTAPPALATPPPAPNQPHAEPTPDLATTLPARRPDLVIRPLGDRGKYVVKDPRSGAFFTFGEQEHFLLLKWGGGRGPAAVCRAFEERFGEPLSEGDLSGFVELARGQGLLQPAGPAAPRPHAGVPAEPRPARPRQSILYWRTS